MNHFKPKFRKYKSNVNTSNQIFDSMNFCLVTLKLQRKGRTLANFSTQQRIQQYVQAMLKSNICLNQAEENPISLLTSRRSLTAFSKANMSLSNIRAERLGFLACKSCAWNHKNNNFGYSRKLQELQSQFGIQELWLLWKQIARFLTFCWRHHNTQPLSPNKYHPHLKEVNT